MNAKGKNFFNSYPWIGHKAARMPVNSGGAVSLVLIEPLDLKLKKFLHLCKNFFNFKSRGSMSTKETAPPEFTGMRAALWPIHGYELKKFLPLAFIMFCLLFNYT